MSESSAQPPKKAMTSRRWLLRDIVAPTETLQNIRKRGNTPARGVHKVTSRTQRLRIVKPPQKKQSFAPDVPMEAQPKAIREQPAHVVRRSAPMRARQLHKHASLKPKIQDIAVASRPVVSVQPKSAQPQAPTVQQPIPQQGAGTSLDGFTAAHAKPIIGHMPQNKPSMVGPMIEEFVPAAPRSTAAAAEDAAADFFSEIDDEPWVIEPTKPKKTKAKKTLAPETEKQQKRGFFSRQPVLISLAAVIFLFGAGVSVWGWQQNKNVQAQIEQIGMVASESTDEAPPSTEAVTDDQVRNYVVAANMPRYLIIEKIGVKARVQTMGLTKSGAVQAPRNVYDAGWYSGSSLPGATGGASFIDGHVSSWSTAGVFKNLSKLVQGDIVKVELGSGEVLSYQVVKTEASNVETVDMQAALTPVTAGKAGLNLMTCHGNVRSGTSEFEQRFVVFTEQI